MLGACATKVYHPTKSDAEMRADVDVCSDDANRRYWMDPVAAMLNAKDCLKAKGYSKNRPGLTAQVETRVREGQPCAVPCKRK